MTPLEQVREILVRHVAQEQRLRNLLYSLENSPDPDPQPDPQPDPDPDPDPDPQPDPVPTSGIWTSAEELARLPRSGPLWENVVKHADRTFEEPDLDNHSEDANCLALANALVFARTGSSKYRDKAILYCERAIGGEGNKRTLGLARKLCAYILSADLVKLPSDVDGKFREWVDKVRFKELGGKTLISTHEIRPNNWGTSAGASRIAAALYLDDMEDLTKAATVFKGWLGDRNAYAGFRYKDVDEWQFDPKRPVGINPALATKNGHIIDGVLPDDMRRAGGFRWPPPKENYVWGALQGVVAQAVMLERAGYSDVWQWSDGAILRAFQWLYEVAGHKAEEFGGDDVHMLPVIDRVYGTNYWDGEPCEMGKTVAFTDWTHGGASRRDE